jgi:hypothetical protein
MTRLDIVGKHSADLLAGFLMSDDGSIELFIKETPDAINCANVSWIIDDVCFGCLRKCQPGV